MVFDSVDGAGEREGTEKHSMPTQPCRTLMSCWRSCSELLWIIYRRWRRATTGGHGNAHQCH